MQITPYCIFRSPNRPTAVYVALWVLRSISHHRPTFHNGSNLYGPVLALRAAGQNTQGIRAEYIPLSDTGSHSTVSFPFRLYALGNESFSFSFPLLWITYWNPAFEEWFKHSFVNFCSSCSLHPHFYSVNVGSFFMKKVTKYDNTKAAVHIDRWGPSLWFLVAYKTTKSKKRNVCVKLSR